MDNLSLIIGRSSDSITCKYGFLDLFPPECFSIGTCLMLYYELYFCVSCDILKLNGVMSNYLDLSGFLCMVTSEDLPKGEYHIGIYAADRCSRQKLFQDAGRVLIIE